MSEPLLRLPEGVGENARYSMNQTRMLAALTSVRDPHHHARGFVRACHCNMNRSDVIDMTFSRNNPVTTSHGIATKICAAEPFAHILSPPAKPLRVRIVDITAHFLNLLDNG